MRNADGAVVRPTLADLYLHAAAPDLLAALSILIERCEHYAPSMGRNGDLDDARAAIAKAVGK